MSFSKPWSKIIWLLTWVVCIVYLSLHFKIESSILKLMPKYESENTNAFIQKATETINKQVVLMASAADKRELMPAFKKQLDDLSKSPLIQNIEYQVDTEKFVDIFEGLSPYRHNLLSIEDKAAMLAGLEPDYFIEQAQQLLYGLQQTSFEQLQLDPLFLFQRYLMGFSQLNIMSFDVSEQFFMVNQAGQHHMVAFIELQNSAFSPENQALFVAELDQLKQQLNPLQIDVTAFGAVLYAHQAYQDAKQEISTVGIGSLLGIVLLILLIFRSPTPLIISLLSIALGLMVALTITMAIYGYVHAFAMVFGATIAGVSIDYCFHYLTESSLDQADETATPEMVLAKIRPALLIGFFSSATVYLAFMITRYEVLGQISVFSVCGLAAVLINVMLIFPSFYQAKAIKHKTLFLAVSGLWLNNPLQMLFRRIPVALVILASLIFMALLTVKPNDDVRALQQLSPQLKQQEQHIKEVLSWQQSSAFVLITAPTLEDVINVEQQLIEAIRAESGQGVHDMNLVAVSDYIPGNNQQLVNYNAIQLLMQSSEMQSYLNELGLSDNNSISFKPIPLQVLEQPFLQQLFKQRLLGQIGDQQALILPLNNSIELDRLPDLPHVVLVRQAEDTSALFAQFRTKSSYVLVITVGLLIVLLGFFRYNFKQAIHLVSIPLISGFTGLVLASALGYHISMFSVLAMLLVLGMGLDYVVFLRETKQAQHVMFALLLSATTTILAFGLLSFSQVPVLNSFGFMVGVGIFTVLCLSPAVMTWAKNQNNED